ncbi:hypothetical protein L218DRAFT_1007551 [Marasmius fiardii PR-910]|nr:hypothetical protein L218DRAFT_1007551 [Marasmius fiardii PR-910]
MPRHIMLADGALAKKVHLQILGNPPVTFDTMLKKNLHRANPAPIAATFLPPVTDIPDSPPAPVPTINVFYGWEMAFSHAFSRMRNIALLLTSLTQPLMLTDHTVLWLQPLWMKIMTVTHTLTLKLEIGSIAFDDKHAREPPECLGNDVVSNKKLYSHSVLAEMSASALKEQPIRLQHLIWEVALIGPHISEPVLNNLLINDGSHLVLICQDIVEHLGLPLEQLYRPEVFGVVSDINSSGLVSVSHFDALLTLEWLHNLHS